MDSPAIASQQPGAISDLQLLLGTTTPSWARPKSIDPGDTVGKIGAHRFCLLVNYLASQKCTRNLSDRGCRLLPFLENTPSLLGVVPFSLSSLHDVKVRVPGLQAHGGETEGRGVGMLTPLVMGLADFYFSWLHQVCSSCVPSRPDYGHM